MTLRKIGEGAPWRILAGPAVAGLLSLSSCVNPRVLVADAPCSGVEPGELEYRIYGAVLTDLLSRRIDARQVFIQQKTEGGHAWVGGWDFASEPVRPPPAPDAPKNAFDEAYIDFETKVGLDYCVRRVPPTSVFPRGGIDVRLLYSAVGFSRAGELALVAVSVWRESFKLGTLLYEFRVSQEELEIVNVQGIGHI